MKEANVALGKTFIYIPAWRQETFVDKASVLDKQNNKPDSSCGRESAYWHL